MDISQEEKSMEEERSARLVRVRRRRLKKLIEEQYKSQADFVRSTGENQGEVSGLLNSKSFGEKKARNLEAKCGLPAGWMDVDDELEPAGNQATATPQTGAPPWMAPEAFELLSLYYEADPDGRAEIMNTARDFRRVNQQRVIHHKR